MLESNPSDAAVLGGLVPLALSHRPNSPVAGPSRVQRTDPAVGMLVHDLPPAIDQALVEAGFRRPIKVQGIAEPRRTLEIAALLSVLAARDSRRHSLPLHVHSAWHFRAGIDIPLARTGRSIASPRR